MKLVQLGPNAHVLEAGGWKVLFSYSLPVAAGHVGGRSMRVSMKYSPTTSKHVNAFLRGYNKPQLMAGPEFDNNFELFVEGRHSQVDSAAPEAQARHERVAEVLENKRAARPERRIE